MWHLVIYCSSLCSRLLTIEQTLHMPCSVQTYHRPSQPQLVVHTKCILIIRLSAKGRGFSWRELVADWRPLSYTCPPLIIIIIKNEKIRVTLCENAAGALYIVNKPLYTKSCRLTPTLVYYSPSLSLDRQCSLSPISIQTLRALRALRLDGAANRMLGRSSGNHDWLLANASACV